jgi:hypothetical protein
VLAFAKSLPSTRTRRRESDSIPQILMPLRADA